MAPLVSVVMLSYNHQRYLPAAIESVLAQTLDDLELVVADDGSSDGSLAVAERYARKDPRVRVLTHPGHVNRGIGATVNLARADANGTYLLGLPSDDVLYPDTLEREVAFLEARPEVGYVYGYAHLIDAQGRRVPDARTIGSDLTGGGRIVERLVQRNTIPAMTVMWRRACLDQAGAEDETLVYGDWESQTRAAAHWEVGFLPRALAMYRRHGANTSLNVTRATNVERALAVTAVLRERAPQIGGRLAEPRIRATLDLQIGYLRFARGEQGSESDLVLAFGRDRSLSGDGRWLADWIWSRTYDELLPDGGGHFPRWVEAAIAPLLEPGAARTVRREAAAATGGLRAVQLAQAGRSVEAHRAALAALVRSPRRAADRRLAAFLLDSIAGGVAAKGVRAAKRRLLRHR
jgi:glycosyltransferase involved in cell wall biosynthesis